MQTKRVKEFGCDVWQGTLCIAAEELCFGAGTDEPSGRDGLQLSASYH